jgi:hypothetical protein
VAFVCIVWFVLCELHGCCLFKPELGGSTGGNLVARDLFVARIERRHQTRCRSVTGEHGRLVTLLFTRFAAPSQAKHNQTANIAKQRKKKPP